MKYTYTHSLVLEDKKTGLVTKTFLVNSDDEYLDIMDNVNSEIWTVKSFGSAHEMNEFDYLHEKHLQTDAEEPAPGDILGAIEWADKIAENMTTDELCPVIDDPEWASPYAEDIR